MKKIQILALLLFFTVTTLSAQLRIGLKAGITSTDLDVSTLMIDEPGLSNRLNLALENANYGIQVGAQIRLYLNNNWMIQPEILFNSNTVEFGVDDLDNPSVSREVFEESYQYVDIPLVLNYELAFLRLQAGPVGHFFLDSRSDLFDFQDYDTNFNDLTIGYVFGVGLDLWNVTVDLRREGNFTKFGSHMRFGDSRFEFNEAPSRWLLTLGYMFGEKPR
jgi:hypothetical protein